MNIDKDAENLVVYILLRKIEKILPQLYRI